MHEAGFLAGALAGKASQGRRVAVVGGLPIPAFEQLAAGFENGVGYACPECEAVVKLTDSFADLALGQEVGRQAVEEGADVVFHAAKACGSAAIRSAAREGAWVIGADWDEYRSTFRGGIAPNADHLLGSVVIRADDQIYDTIKRLVQGDFESGSFVLGVAEGSIEFLPSPESAHPQWPELDEYLKEVAEGLRSGRIRP